MVDLPAPPDPNSRTPSAPVPTAAAWIRCAPWRASVQRRMLRSGAPPPRCHDGGVAQPLNPEARLGVGDRERRVVVAVAGQARRPRPARDLLALAVVVRPPRWPRGGAAGADAIESPELDSRTLVRPRSTPPTSRGRAGRSAPRLPDARAPARLPAQRERPSGARRHRGARNVHQAGDEILSCGCGFVQPARVAPATRRRRDRCRGAGPASAGPACR